MGPGFESPEVHHFVIILRFSEILSIYSSLAQSVERMTVNHDVAGSSPAGGAKKKDRSKTVFFLSKPTAEAWHGITARRAVHGIAA